MRTLTTMLLAALAGPPALAGGGAGGLVIDGLYWPRYGDPTGDHAAPGPVGCIGGVGYAVLDSGLRIGGEGAGCRGRSGVRTAQGGLQLGWRPPVDGAYLTAFGTVGLGSFGDDTALSGPYRSFYGHLTPQVGVGWGVRGQIVEVSLGLRVPVQLAQWITPDATPRGFVTPTPLARVALMWGRVHRSRPRDEGPGWRPASPDDDARPLAQPGPPGEPEAPPAGTAPIDASPTDAPPPEPPPADGGSGGAEEDRPLAIPVGAED